VFLAAKCGVDNKTLVNDKAILGTLVEFEGSHIVRMLNEKVKTLLATLTWSQAAKVKLGKVAQVNGH
jgi:hypothetical protein